MKKPTIEKKIETIHVGTSHFLNFEAAFDYYRTQGIGLSEVHEKIHEEKAISIGKPTLKKGQTAYVNAEGRWVIVTTKETEGEPATPLPAKRRPIKDLISKRIDSKGPLKAHAALSQIMWMIYSDGGRLEFGFGPTELGIQRHSSVDILDQIENILSNYDLEVLGDGPDPEEIF